MSMTEQLRQAADTFRMWLRDADHVLIGAGAGLSAAAGIDYTDTADFARVFPAFARRGLRARYQLIGYRGLSQAQHWAYWATHVNNVRFGPRPHPVYATLRELVTGKDTFVLTSNVDAMFVRNGFDAERIFTPQGDYAAMQCRKPCRRVVWPSEPAVARALENLDSEGFEVTAPDAVPRCPSCGGEVFLNVRLDRGFVEEPYQPQAERLNAWLSRAVRGRLLLIEIGAGFNTPVVVRLPMERLLRSLPDARMLRINRDDADVEGLPADRIQSIGGDAGVALSALAQTGVAAT